MFFTTSGCGDCDKSRVRKRRAISCVRCERVTCAECIETVARSRTSSYSQHQAIKCRNCSTPLPVQEAAHIAPIAAALSSGPKKCHDVHCGGTLEPPPVHDTNFWECHICNLQTCVLCGTNHPENCNCDGRRILRVPRWKLRCASCYEKTERKITDFHYLTVCTECNWTFCTLCRTTRGSAGDDWHPCRCEKAIRVAKLCTRMGAYTLGLPLAIAAIIVASPALILMQAVSSDETYSNIIEQHLGLDDPVPQERGRDPDHPAWASV